MNKKEIQIRGNTLHYWRIKAEQDYMDVPISVDKYITILEEIVEESLLSTWRPISEIDGVEDGTLIAACDFVRGNVINESVILYVTESIKKYKNNFTHFLIIPKP